MAKKDLEKKWALADVRANLRKPRKRSKTFLSIRDRVQRNLGIGADELSEAIEGLASLASDGELPAGISKEDIDHVQTNIMLDENDIDNPESITRHMNALPSISTRWGMIGVKVERALLQVKTEYDRWNAEARIDIRNVLFQKSRNEGATANNAVPTKTDIESHFLVLYSDDPDYTERKQLHDDMKHVKDYIEVIISQLKTASDMIMNVGHMNRMCVEQGAIIIKKRKRV